MKRQNIYLFFVVIFVVAAMASQASGAERREPVASDVRNIVGGGAGWADASGTIHFEDDAQVGTFRSIVLCIRRLLFRPNSLAPRMSHEQRMAMLGLD